MRIESPEWIPQFPGKVRHRKRPTDDRPLPLDRPRSVLVSTVAAPEQITTLVHLALHGGKTRAVDPDGSNRSSRRYLSTLWQCDKDGRSSSVLWWIPRSDTHRHPPTSGHPPASREPLSNPTPLAHRRPYRVARNETASSTSRSFDEPAWSQWLADWAFANLGRQHDAASAHNICELVLRNVPPEEPLVGGMKAVLIH